MGKTVSPTQATIRSVVTIAIITQAYTDGIRILMNGPSRRRRVKREVTLPGFSLKSLYFRPHSYLGMISKFRFLKDSSVADKKFDANSP